MAPITTHAIRHHFQNLTAPLCAFPFTRRFLFFPIITDDGTSQVDALAKSDKKSFKSVAAVLHLGEEAAVGGGLSDSMFDMKQVKTKPSKTNRRKY